MDKEFEKELVKNHPKIFTQKNLPLWIENGWFLIVDNVCRCIQHYINDNKLQQMEITAIKKVNHELKIYTKGADKRMEGMIWLTEYMSWQTCENCATTIDIVHTDGITKTLCENCCAEYEKKIR